MRCTTFGKPRPTPWVSIYRCGMTHRKRGRMFCWQQAPVRVGQQGTGSLAEAERKLNEVTEEAATRVQVDQATRLCSLLLLQAWSELLDLSDPPAQVRAVVLATAALLGEVPTHPCLVALAHSWRVRSCHVT
eukprot:1115685-Amphidinium_carterae.1